MKKREGLGCARVGGRWHGEGGGGLPRIGASSVVWGGIFGFLRLILAGKGLLSWKPSGLTSPAGCGRSCESEFYCHIWFGVVCLYIQSLGGK